MLTVVVTYVTTEVRLPTTVYDVTWAAIKEGNYYAHTANKVHIFPLRNVSQVVETFNEPVPE